MTAPIVAACPSGDGAVGDSRPVLVEGAATNRDPQDRAWPVTVHPTAPSPAPQTQQRQDGA